MIPVIETDHLILRGFRDSDRDSFAAMNADPEVMRYFPAPLSRAESDALLDRARCKWRELGLCYFAAEVKGAGFLWLHRLQPAALPGPFHPVR